MSDSIFTRIIKGEIPSHRVYEDDLVYAFLDINPLSRGHTLVVPKEQAERLHLLSERSSAALGRALPRIARAIMKATSCTDYNLLQNNGPAAGQIVMHVHFHIIPKHADGTGLPHTWPAKPLDKDTGAALARQISAAIERE